MALACRVACLVLFKTIKSKEVTFLQNPENDPVENDL
jgi:hypothetical protein